ncbi:MAG: hypothetical protein AB8G11_11905 [Saprospiraceae bacterium]
MKINLLIFSILLSIAVFGQNPEQTYELPLSSKGIFKFTNHNQLFELFPKDLMQKNGIKSAVIFKEKDADVPSLHIGQEPDFEFDFDKNGYLSKSQEIGKIFHYKDGKITLEQTMYRGFSGNTWQWFLDEKQDEQYTISNNQIIRLIKGKIEDYTLDEFGESADSTKNEPTITFLKYYDNDYFDELNRLIKNEKYTLRNEKKGKTFETIIHYNNENYFAVIEHARPGNNKDTVFFDTQWRPVRSARSWRFVPSFFQNITYNDNNQIIRYQEETFKPYSKEKPNERGLIEKRQLQHEGEVIDFTCRLVFDDISFHYNDDGFLEKIIQTTDQGTCEYRIYYYRK